MTDDNELRVLRERIEALESLAARLEQDAVPPAAVIVGETSEKETYPTEAEAWYWMGRRTVGGPSVEGGEVEIASSGRGFFAANIGSRIPPEGTAVECLHDGRSWFFRY